MELEAAAERLKTGAERVCKALHAADRLADSRTMEHPENHIRGRIAVVIDGTGAGGDSREQRNRCGMLEPLARNLVGSSRGKRGQLISQAPVANEGADHLGRARGVE